MTAQEGQQTTPESAPERPPRRPSSLPRDAITCPRCDNWWSGLIACHCSECHRTFTGAYAFDMHRAGSHAHGKRHCVDPERVGLIPANRLWRGWSRPGTWEGPDDA